MELEETLRRGVDDKGFFLLVPSPVGAVAAASTSKQRVNSTSIF